MMVIIVLKITTICDTFSSINVERLFPMVHDGVVKIMCERVSQKQMPRDTGHVLVTAE